MDRTLLNTPFLNSGLAVCNPTQYSSWSIYYPLNNPPNIKINSFSINKHHKIDEVARKHILLLEDNEIIANAIQTILRAEGWDVIWKRNLPELHNIELKQSISLIILGCESSLKATPKLDAIKSEFEAVPIALFIHSVGAADFIGALCAGANAIFLPTMSIAELCEGINIVLNGNAFAPRELLQKYVSDSLIQTNTLTAQETNSLQTQSLPTSAAVRLCTREHEVLFLLTEGMSNKEIARNLEISVGTVKNYVASLLQKFGASSRTKLLCTIATSHPKLLNNKA